MVTDRLELDEAERIKDGPGCSCCASGNLASAAAGRGRGLPSLLTALLVAALPKCPMCLIAYAGVLGSLGLGSSAGMALYETWVLPASVLCLILAVCLIATRSRSRRGYGPAALAAFAGTTILLGKFWLEQQAPVTVGLSLMLVAAVWNAMPTNKSVRLRL